MGRRGEKAAVAEIKLPAGMPPRAVKEFRRVRAELARCGVMEIDRPALMAYLTHFALWDEARDKLSADGPVIVTCKGQLQISPWHSVMKQNSELMKKWVQELGFSPGSRKRLAMDLTEAPTDDELFE